MKMWFFFNFFENIDVINKQLTQTNMCSYYDINLVQEMFFIQIFLYLQFINYYCF